MYSFNVKSIFHEYEVQFIDDFAETLTGLLQDGDYIIIDNKIKGLYKVDSILEANKYISIDANEQQKSYQGVLPIIQELIDNGFHKNHRLIAIGGGITQDVTAFISSIIYRGVKWFFFPTTLLAQCDSCIGSKTSINFGEYKNQIGGFYPPHLIYIDPHFLNTLTEGEMKSGLGEMLHYFIVSGKDDFIFYRDSYQKAFTDDKILSKLIARSLEIKKVYIEVDEFDKNVRQVFNYGHSFGHAIESLTHYKIPHGIAVSYGMDMANFISVKLGILPESIRYEVRSVVETIWEGYPLENIDVDAFLKALGKDKKNIGSKLGLILNKGYGNIFKHVMDSDSQFHSWIMEYFSNE